VPEGPRASASSSLSRFQIPIPFRSLRAILGCDVSIQYRRWFDRDRSRRVKSFRQVVSHLKYVFDRLGLRGWVDLSSLSRRENGSWSVSSRADTEQLLRSWTGSPGCCTDRPGSRRQTVGRSGAHLPRIELLQHRPESVGPPLYVDGMLLTCLRANLSRPGELADGRLQTCKHLRSRRRRRLLWHKGRPWTCHGNTNSLSFSRSSAARDDSRVAWTRALFLLIRRRRTGSPEWWKKRSVGRLRAGRSRR